MTIFLININERLISDFSNMNHKGLGPIVAWLDSRKYKLHLVGQIHTFDVTEMSNKGLRPRERCILVQNGINNSNFIR